MTTEQPEVHKTVIKKQLQTLESLKIPQENRGGFPTIAAKQRSSWFKAPACAGKGLLNPPKTVVFQTAALPNSNSRNWLWISDKNCYTTASFGSPQTFFGLYSTRMCAWTQEMNRNCNNFHWSTLITHPNIVPIYHGFMIQFRTTTLSESNMALKKHIIKSKINEHHLLPHIHGYN